MKPVSSRCLSCSRSWGVWTYSRQGCRWLWRLQPPVARVPLHLLHQAGRRIRRCSPFRAAMEPSGRHGPARSRRWSGRSSPVAVGVRSTDGRIIRPGVRYGRRCGESSEVDRTGGWIRYRAGQVLQHGEHHHGFMHGHITLWARYQRQARSCRPRRRRRSEARRRRRSQRGRAAHGLHRVVRSTRSSLVGAARP